MIRFLVTGLVRDRTRSLFPAVTVIAGVMLTVFLQTYLKGINSNMSDASAAFSTGHLKLVSRAAAKEGEQASNELAMNKRRTAAGAGAAAVPPAALDAADSIRGAARHSRTTRG